MDSGGSVTRLIRSLRQGDQQAASPLWDKYFQQLAGAARAQLNGIRLAAGDEDDVALSAFHSFCQRIEQGQFADIQGRQELWRILVVIARRKAISWLRHETAQKRGSGAVRGPALLDGVVASEPTPELMAELLDEMRHLLQVLRREDATLCLVAQRKLEGRSNAEIAAELSLTPRSVQRKVQRICIVWSADADARGMLPPRATSD